MSIGPARLAIENEVVKERKKKRRKEKNIMGRS
jgi:hypothetical protein